MAFTGLLALVDDIATVLDDVVVMTKIAAKNTAGVLGDDLALNAEQVSGVRAEREIPVVWAVAKGSFINKLFLVPAAMGISAFIPWLITPLLIFGGLYLCFEGVEKCVHGFVHRDQDKREHDEKLKALSDQNLDLVAFEKNKIKGAIRTDFILSAEIIVIVLGSVKDASLLLQTLVVSSMAILVTVGVYGLVAAIVKMDDLGLYLIESKRRSLMFYSVGKGLLLIAPRLMKLLSVVGTIAMFLVGGGILVHGLPFMYHALHLAKDSLVGDIASLEILMEIVFSGLSGVIAGFIVLGFLTLYEKGRRKLGI